MPARGESYSDLERALRRVFPGGAIEIRPSESRGHAPSAHVEVRASAGSLGLQIKLLDNATRARLIDAVELQRASRGDSPAAIPVLAAPYLSASSQALLRDSHTAFIDYAGNAWIVAPGVHVDRRGFPNPVKEQRAHRDVFSDKASLVVRTLMAADSPLGVRQIAEMVGARDEDVRLSPGYVSKVVKELERRGYAAKRDEGIVLRHAKELLGDWVVSYRERRSPVSRSYFMTAPNAESIVPGLAQALAAHRVDYVFTGHAGASLVARHADFDVVDVYVKHLDDAEDTLASIGARRVDRGGNVRVSYPYYRESAFYDAQVPREGIRVASDIQLYLDLYDTPVRGREQAEHLYERRIRPMIERVDAL